MSIKLSKVTNNARIKYEKVAPIKCGPTIELDCACTQVAHKRNFSLVVIVIVDI